MKRSATLTRETPLKRGGFLRRISEAQRQKNAEFRKNRRIRAESVQYRCEAGLLGTCDGYGTDAHHVVRRSQGGDNSVDNLRWLCRSCHAHVHSHVEWAMSVGLLASSAPDRRLPASATAETTRVHPPDARARAARSGAVPFAMYSTREKGRTA